MGGTPSSPLLDDYNRTGIVTPALQRALDMARQKLGQQFQLQPSPAASGPVVPLLRPPSPPVPSIARPAADYAPGLTDSSSAPTPAPTAPLAGLAAPRSPLITDPDAGAHLVERDRLIRTGSGISQVHNPVARGLLRGLDVLGSAFLPGITAGIPGTELHHNYLVKRAENAVTQDTTRARENAQTAKTEAEMAAIPGEEALRKARMKNLLNPPEKQGDPTKTLETAEGIMQWNPETGRYDIPVGQAPGKNAMQHVMTADGSVVALEHDPKTGKVTANVVYKGDPKVETELADLLISGKMHKVLVNKRSGETVKDLGETRQAAAGADHGVTMIGQDGKVYRLQPGETTPEGAVTPAGMSSMNVPTAATRTMAEKAPRVLNFVTRIGQLLDENEKQLGPLQSRWNEFTAGKIGLPNKGYTQLRTDLGLLHTALMNMHVGARGGEKIMEHFQSLLDGTTQSPENLRAALGEIKAYAKEVAKENKLGASQAAGGDSGGGGQIPTITTKAEYDKLPSGAVYMEDGKKFKKP